MMLVWRPGYQFRDLRPNFEDLGLSLGLSTTVLGSFLGSAILTIGQQYETKNPPNYSITELNTSTFVLMADVLLALCMSHVFATKDAF